MRRADGPAEPAASEVNGPVPSSNERAGPFTSYPRRESCSAARRFPDEKIFGSSPEQVGHKLNVLRAHCDALGRDYDAIAKTIIGRVDPDADISPFLAEMEQYARLGVSLVEVAPLPPDHARFVVSLGEKVLPRLAQIG